MIVCQHQGHYAVFLFYLNIAGFRRRRKLRKDFKESKLCREKRYKAQSTL